MSGASTRWEQRLLSGALFDGHRTMARADEQGVSVLSGGEVLRRLDLSGQDACSTEFCRTVNLCKSIHVCPRGAEFSEFTGLDACSTTQCYTTNACPSTSMCPSVQVCPGVTPATAAPAARLWPPALI